MPTRRWSKRRVVSSGFVVIRRLCRFAGVGGATWSTSASVCAIPTMRTSMAARGKAVSSAVSSGRHEITKGMRKIRSIGQDIEWWWKVNEVQIPGTKIALYRAFLDSLALKYHDHTIRKSLEDPGLTDYPLDDLSLLARYFDRQDLFNE